ncbi:MAG: hypothetical protein H7841_09730 [Magnetospirillum sp. WYHS-4]
MAIDQVMDAGLQVGEGSLVDVVQQVFPFLAFGPPRARVRQILQPQPLYRPMPRKARGGLGQAAAPVGLGIGVKGAQDQEFPFEQLPVRALEILAPAQQADQDLVAQVGIGPGGLGQAAQAQDARVQPAFRVRPGPFAQPVPQGQPAPVPLEAGQHAPEFVQRVPFRPLHQGPGPAVEAEEVVVDGLAGPFQRQAVDGAQHFHRFRHVAVDAVFQAVGGRPGHAVAEPAERRRVQLPAPFVVGRQGIEQGGQDFVGRQAFVGGDVGEAAGEGIQLPVRVQGEAVQPAVMGHGLPVRYARKRPNAPAPDAVRSRSRWASRHWAKSSVAVASR